MQVKIKKLKQNAVIPKKAHDTDAGFDFTAIDVRIEESTGAIVYGTGIAIEIPENHVGLLFMRSSVANKDIDLTNAVGVIDHGYIGEITFKYKPDMNMWDYAKTSNDTNEDFFQFELEHGKIHYYHDAEDEFRKMTSIGRTYGLGERIGQLIILPYPKVELIEVEELSETERGVGAYGSTGN